MALQDFLILSPDPTKGVINNAYQFQATSQHNELQFPYNTPLMQLQGMQSSHPWPHNVNTVIGLEPLGKAQNLLQGTVERNPHPTLLNGKGTPEDPKVSIVK
jgi:hypothetical protein